MITYKAEVFDNAKYALGEGPYYDPRYGRLSWVDILDNCLWTLSADGEKRNFDLGQPIGAAIPRKHSEGFLLAAADGLYSYENGKARLAKDLRKVYKPYWRSNDAKADPRGRIFFGASVRDDKYEAEGALYSYDASLRIGDVDSLVTCMQPDTKIANGMAWSADQKKFYFSDSLEHAVFVYDYDVETGNISDRKVLFTVENGVPDGMCIDSEDNLYLAVWGGSRVEKRSGQTGELLAVIETMAEHTTSCCFGGEQMKTLFITSSGDGLNGEFDGCIFKCELDVKGVAPDYAKI
ncbi:SMP-30/gluconolactonase/LRE family protein [Butyrivibrio sp. CB08]|uniref:SMP-30/gluconolactonase/LRE family protein n=1 Tax=Butyrivibrio sp. CB08 TaxID=2364879 RepID=UPI000EA88B76|nr:SMP-30/gluconolactonase/LRE family protein [Butyrivibrio sp. CB08]RKM61903.1 SMP-30/gluconolactonase/LRE family protein [Butyrivibrio sp. CB08]